MKSGNKIMKNSRMKYAIKQQKQIINFLNHMFEKDLANIFFQEQSKILDEMLIGLKQKSSKQRKTLQEVILPRIALYHMFLKENFTKEEASIYVNQYMIEVVGKEKHDFTAKIEKIPGFYFIYSRIFLLIMKTTKLQESTQKVRKESYDITIKKCLWYTACKEQGSVELCRIFCDVDNITYHDLKKIGFRRTQTLGYGDSCCDFHFYKK